MLPLLPATQAAIEAKSPPPAGPLWVQLEISNVCNIRCEFCAMHGPSDYRQDGFGFPLPNSRSFGYDARSAAWLTERMKTRFMNWEIFVRAVDQTLEMGAHDFNLCGLGEPTLNPLYPRMIRYISERGVRVSLDTNGSGFAVDESIDPLNDLGLYGLHVSLNAATEPIYRKVNGSRFSFGRIIGALNQLMQGKRDKGVLEPWVLLSLIVTRTNAMEILPFVRLAHSVGAHQVVIDHMIPGQLSLRELPSEKEKAHVMNLIDEAKLLAERLGVNLQSNYHALDASIQYHIPCVIGYLFTRIQADGTVQGCCGCMHSLGSITKSSFSEIWHGGLYEGFRQEEHRIHVTHEPVSDCLCASCPHVLNNIDYVKMRSQVPLPEVRQFLGV